MYYVFMFNQNACPLSAIYTSSKLPDTDMLQQIKDFNIGFSYFGNRVFDVTAWLTRDGLPYTVWVSEEEMQRRVNERNEKFDRQSVDIIGG